MIAPSPKLTASSVQKSNAELNDFRRLFHIGEMRDTEIPLPGAVLRSSAIRLSSGASRRTGVCPTSAPCWRRRSRQACGPRRAAAKSRPQANVERVDTFFSENQIRAITFPSPDQAAGQRSMTKEGRGNPRETLGWSGDGQEKFCSKPP